jgi:hypothetical protein
LFLCATDKDVKCCFECREFPCETHYRKDMVYTRESLDNWKELMAKPREYFTKIKERFEKRDSTNFRLFYQSAIHFIRIDVCSIRSFFTNLKAFHEKIMVYWSQ